MVNWLDLAVLGAVAAASVCQVLSGVGFALICSPLLIIALGHSDGLRLTLVLSVVVNLVVLTRGFHQVRVGDALRLLVPAAVLVVPALLIGAQLGGPGVLAASGAGILVATALLASGWRPAWVRGPVGALLAGAASGVLNVLAATSGPPVALFAAARGWEPPVTTATLQAYALPLNLLTLAAVGLPTLPLTSLTWASAGLLLGTVVAIPLTSRVDRRTLRRLTLTLAATGGALLIIRAL